MAIASVIKYDGDNSAFIWKHPDEDFNCFTQLIVHESQQAIFFKDGQVMDVFHAGRYTLDSQNIPILGKFVNLAMGGESPFHCEVYFINTTVQMDMKWGTDSKVRYIDPESGVPLELGASGSMNLAVSSGEKLIMKLVGTTKGISWNDGGAGFAKSLRDSFRPLISNAVKANLTTTIKALGVDILEIDEHLDVLSDKLKERILPGFEEFGITIPHFYLTTVVLPEEDPNFKRIRELHTISLQTRMAAAEAQVRTAQAAAQAQVTAAERQVELERQTTQTEVARRAAERRVIDAQAEAQATRLEGFAEADVMAAQGVSKKDYLEAEVQKAFAEGLGQMGSSGGGGSTGGGIAGDMIGMMAGMKMAETAFGRMDGMFPSSPSPTPTEPPVKKCTGCGAVIPDKSKFCLECGLKVEEAPAPGKLVECPNCGKSVPEGKYCIECGTPFERKCPACGAAVPAGGKFCLECGNKM